MSMRAVPERGSIMIHVLRWERPVPFVHAAGRTTGHWRDETRGPRGNIKELFVSTGVNARTALRGLEVQTDRPVTLPCSRSLSAGRSLPAPPLPIRRERSLHRAPTPGGAPSQLLKKIKTRGAPFLHLHLRPLAPHVCGWWQIIIIDWQLCPWKDISNPARRKKKDEAHAFRYTHNH